MSDGTLKIAVLTGAFALGGVSVTTLGGLLANRLSRNWSLEHGRAERKYTATAELMERRREIYSDLLVLCNLAFDDAVERRQNVLAGARPAVKPPITNWDFMGPHNDAYNRALGQAELLADGELRELMKAFDDFITDEIVTASVGKPGQGSKAYVAIKERMAEAMRVETRLDLK